MATHEFWAIQDKETGITWHAEEYPSRESARKAKKERAILAGRHPADYRVVKIRTVYEHTIIGEDE